MPAHDFEVEEALHEGVFIKWLSTIRNMGDEGTLTVEKMCLDEINALFEASRCRGAIKMVPETV